MSSRCHMQLNCRTADETLFRKLGFTVMDRRGAVVAMEDPSAVRPHDGDLPWNAIYHGSHGPGVQYDGAEFACNGQSFASVPIGREGGVIVHLEVNGAIHADDLEEWLRFVALRNEVVTMLAELETHFEPTPLLPSLAELQQQAAITATHDPWILSMIKESATEWLTSIQDSLSRPLTAREKEQLINAYQAGHFQSCPIRNNVSRYPWHEVTYEI